MESRTIYDVVIIGAGPAGATLASQLDVSLRTLIVDKRNLHQQSSFKKEKCCGGLLAPDAQKALAHLGIGIPKEILVGPQMFSVKTEDFDNHLTKHYQRHYINVDREKFDRFMVEQIPEHIDCAFETIYKGHQVTDGNLSEVYLETSKGPEKVLTKILVGADGATSKIRRELFALRRQPKRYMALQRWYKTEAVMPFYMSVFDKNVTDFYSWVIQKDGYLIVGSAIKDETAVKEKFDCLIQGLEERGYTFGEMVKEEGTWIMRPGGLFDINLTKDSAVLIGEAAGFISPSSAEGISYGIRSGLALAKALNGGLNHFTRRYRKSCYKLKLNIFFKRLKSTIMYNKYLRNIVIRIGVLSMEIDGERREVN